MCRTLPSELLRTVIRRGTITPQFCRADNGDDTGRELADTLIGQFTDVQKKGGSRGDLISATGPLESEYDHRLVRGLFALLDRRSVFERSNAFPSNASPMLVRQKLFEESSKRGLALDDSQRRAIIKRVARQMHITPGDIEAMMWGDRDENLILTRFDSISPQDLIMWYNLSLFQTLLFKCTVLEFSIRGGLHWKRVLRDVKRYGLMYTLERHSAGRSGKEGRRRRSKVDEQDGDGAQEESVTCILEGPLSLFKMTDRYGTSMAKLLPSIVSTPDWRISGSITKRTDDGPKIYSFDLSSKDVRGLFHYTETTNHAYRNGDNANGDSDVVYNNSDVVYNNSDVVYNNSNAGDDGHFYDSSTEAAFAKRFCHHFDQSDRFGWKIHREPDPLIADGKAMIPDFLFERFGRKVYFEIVGFWTREYLERKATKLRALLGHDNNGRDGGNSGIDLLVAVNSDLACSSQISEISKDRIFTFRKEVPLKPILEHLAKIDAEITLEKLHTKIRLSGKNHDLISLKDIALKNSIPETAALKILLADHPDVYVAVGAYLISRRKIDSVKGRLDGVSGFVDACRVLASNSIPDTCHADLLSKMGYDVTWEDLNPDHAKISKRKG